MKNINISQMLLKAAKSSSLMIVALASFVQIDCKSTNNKKQQKQKHVKAKPVAKRPDQRQNRVAASAVAANVVESDSHNVVVNERPINPAMPEESSVDVQTVQLPDGGFQEIQTTVEVNQEEGKVIETVETWTWYDYAKAAAITAGVAGGAYLAYQNQDAIASTLSAGYNRAGDLGSNMSQRAQNMFGYGSQAPVENAVSNGNVVAPVNSENQQVDLSAAAAAAQQAVDAAMSDAAAQGIAPEDSAEVQEAQNALITLIQENPTAAKVAGLTVGAGGLFAASRTASGKEMLANAGARLKVAGQRANSAFVNAPFTEGGVKKSADAVYNEAWTNYGRKANSATESNINQRAEQLVSELESQGYKLNPETKHAEARAHLREELVAAQDAGIYNTRNAPYENALNRVKQEEAIEMTKLNRAQAQAAGEQAQAQAAIRNDIAAN